MNGKRPTTWSGDHTMISTIIVFIINHSTSISKPINTPRSRLLLLDPHITQIPSPLHTTLESHQSDQYPNQTQTRKKMDTSLINLIPNLTKAHRSITLPRKDFIGLPPPYTLAPHPRPQRKHNTWAVGVPLHIKTLGAASETTGKRPVTWSDDDSIALEPSSTYEEFLGILGRKLSDVKFSKESKQWKTEIVAEVSGRKLWQSKEQVVCVTKGNWRGVLRGLREGRFRGLRVLCWRGDDGD